MTIRAALVGCGRWGLKLLGALCRQRELSVVAVADPDRAARARAAALVPAARLCATVDEALPCQPDAVLVATPSPCHADHGLAALAAGADLWVEKPLCLSASDARRLCDAARELGRVGLTGHVLRYHPAVERLTELCREGWAGPVRQLWARRATQSGSVSPLWTLGPHDLATLHALDPSDAVAVSARDVVTAGAREVHVEVALASGLRAHLELCTTAVTAERRLSVCGDRRRLLIDELASAAALMTAAPDGTERWPAPSDVRVIELDRAEPLMVELRHFARCVRERTSPRTDLDEGRWVVEVLERAEASRGPRAHSSTARGPRREACP